MQKSDAKLYRQVSIKCVIPTLSVMLYLFNCARYLKKRVLKVLRLLIIFYYLNNFFLWYLLILRESKRIREMIRTSFQMYGKYLQVFILDELFSETISEIQEKILIMIRNKKPKGVLFDVSMLDIIDTYAATVIIETLKMINLLGAKSVLIGLKPEIVSYLTQTSFNFENVDVAKNMEEGLELFKKKDDFINGT